MEILSDSHEISVLCIGKIPESRNEIKGFGTEITHFLGDALSEYVNVTLYDAYDDEPQDAEKHDFVMSLCPNGREKLLDSPYLMNKGITVVFQEFIHQGETMPQIQVTFGPRGNLPALTDWGKGTLYFPNQFMLFPFTTKEFTGDKAKKDKILLDAPAVREGKRIEIPDDTEFIYDVLYDLDLDVEVWQGGVSEDTSPPFINAIDEGFGVDDDYRVSWNEYMEHIRDSKMLICTHPESYGINKIHATASCTEVIGRWERFPYYKKFQWRNFTSRDSLEWQIKDALETYEDDYETLEERRNMIWSYDRLAQELKNVFENVNMNAKGTGNL